MKRALYILILGFLINVPLFGQNTEENKPTGKPKVTVSFFDGTVIAGYVDQGAYLNFMGPNIHFSKGKSKLALGMLPSLRFKEDHSTPKNAPVMPTLGAGITYSYSRLAIQVPLYYNAKTATQNGQWHLGIGLGVRLK